MTPKQERFVAEYLVDLNATQAAVRAGYSAKTADTQGPRLLGNVGVSGAIAKGQSRVLAKAEVTAERVLKELGRLAFSDVRKLFDDKGNLLAIKSLDDETAPAVAGVEVVKRNVDSGDGKTDDIHKIKIWDKPRSLEMLAKHFSLLVEKQDINITVSLVNRLQEGRRRVMRLPSGNGAA